MGQLAKIIKELTTVQTKGKSPPPIHYIDEKKLGIMKAILDQIKDVEKIEELFSKIGNKDKTPLHYATDNKNSAVMKSILDQIKDVKQVKKLLTKQYDRSFICLSRKPL